MRVLQCTTLHPAAVLQPAAGTAGAALPALLKAAHSALPVLVNSLLEMPFGGGVRQQGPPRGCLRVQLCCSQVPAASAALMHGWQLFHTHPSSLFNHT